MIPLCNLHTHTVFCDGKNTPEEMVLSAVKLGCQTLGFSGHAPASALWGHESWCMNAETFQAYWKEIQSLKNKYRDSVEILCGVELDYYSDPLLVKPDYIIGSVHQIKKEDKQLPIDAEPQLLSDGISTMFDGDVLAFAKQYYELVSHVVLQTKCDIVGHFDLLTKFNEHSRYLDETDARYRSLACEALDTVLEKDVFFEINTGAISRGWKQSPYPSPFLLKRIVEKQGRLVLNSDAHTADALLCGFAEAVELARSCGVRELWVIKSGKFVPFAI